MKKIITSIYILLILLAVGLATYSFLLGEYLVKTGCPSGVEIEYKFGTTECSWKQIGTEEEFLQTTRTSGSFNPNTGEMSLTVSFDYNFLLPLLFIVLITFLFYRNTWDRLVLKAYNSFANQDIKKESIFISIIMFLYVFIFFAGWRLSAFQFPLRNMSLSSAFIASLETLLIAVPLSISI